MVHRDLLYKTYVLHFDIAKFRFCMVYYDTLKCLQFREIMRNGQSYVRQHVSRFGSLDHYLWEIMNYLVYLTVFTNIMLF